MEYLDFVERYQGLIGALVTLVAAFVGFYGVIYSQRHLVAMAEADRRHDEQVGKDQARQQRLDELMSFLNAVLGELSSLQGAMADAVRLLQAQIAIAEELARSGAGRKTQPRIAFRFATPVFDSHVGRIGLLSPELSYKVSKLFGQVKGFSSQAQEQVPDMEPALAIRVMRSVEAALETLRGDADTLKNDLTTAAAAALRDRDLPET